MYDTASLILNSILKNYYFYSLKFLFQLKKIIVFSGAGISAESGLKTFRDSDGLWENYNIYDVASPDAWKRNPKLVLDFYNMRRKQVRATSPNEAHHALVKLENLFDVEVITQNVDDLHERAGSQNVLHLHGEILKSRSINDDDQRYVIDGNELNLGDLCPNQHQLRPDVVWFGEAVPMMEEAISRCKNADLFIIIGTSLNVYPAANLVNYISPTCKKYLIDPQHVDHETIPNLVVISEKASVGVPNLVELLLQEK